MPTCSVQRSESDVGCHIKYFVWRYTDETKESAATTHARDRPASSRLFSSVEGGRAFGVMLCTCTRMSHSQLMLVRHSKCTGTWLSVASREP